MQTKSQSEWYKKNAERMRQRSKLYRDSDPERWKEVRRRYKENNPESYKQSNRRSNLKQKFDITPEQFDAMLLSQGFACAICGNGNSGGRGTWHVDHCHATNRIRGLLCQPCNTALGLFRDNPVILKSAIRYLKGI